MPTKLMAVSSPPRLQRFALSGHADTESCTIDSIRRAFRLFVTGTLCVAAAVHASAAPPPNLGDLSLEQLMQIPVETVFSASKYEQITTRAPASVSIVGAEDIAAFGHRTLADVLRSVRGLWVADDSNYSYLGVRGFLRPGDYNTRVLVLVDGHRMNDNIYDSAYFGHDNVIGVEAIDHVEIVRGPSSSVYGTSAFFGVVNVVTKRGHQLNGLEVSADAGSYGSYRSRVSYGRTFGNQAELFISASTYDSDGRRAIYYPEFDRRIGDAPGATGDGLARNADAERARNVMTTLRVGEFTLSGFLSSRMKQVPTASFLTVFADPRERTDDERGYVDLQFDHELSNAVTFHGRAFWDFYSYHGDYPEYADPEAGSGPILISKDQVAGRWAGIETQLTGKIAGGHTLIAGAEFRRNLEQQQISYYETQPRSYDVNDNRRSSILALYAQAELALRRDLRLNGGLRYDDYAQSFGGTLNPRVALIFNPVETTALKLLYGQAFRAPNAYEHFYYPPPADQPLQPERIRTVELALEHDFGRHLRAELSVYHDTVHDLLTQTPAPDGTFYFANINHTSATGAECELQARFTSGLRLRTSYTLQRTEDSTKGQELTNSPRQLAKAGVVYAWARNRFTAATELQYEGRVRTLAGREAAGFLLGNITFNARDLVGGLQLSVSVYNLFDKRYGYPGAVDHLQNVLPQPGRTFRVMLTRKF